MSYFGVFAYKFVRIENIMIMLLRFAYDIFRLGLSTNFTYVKYSGGRPHVARQLDKYLFSKSIVVSPIKSFLLPKS